MDQMDQMDRKDDNDEYVIININYLPIELIRYTKPHVSKYIVKSVRKLRTHELPINYRICKGLNDFFYKKYIGYDIDIKQLERSIALLTQNRIHCKKEIINPLSLNFWQDPSITDACIHREIENKKQRIEILKIFMAHYYPIYCQSTTHLEKFKIVELHH